MFQTPNLKSKTYIRVCGNPKLINLNAYTVKLSHSLCQWNNLKTFNFKMWGHILMSSRIYHAFHYTYNTYHTMAHDFSSIYQTHRLSYAITCRLTTYRRFFITCRLTAFFRPVIDCRLTTFCKSTIIAYQS